MCLNIEIPILLSDFLHGNTNSSDCIWLWVKVYILKYQLSSLCLRKTASTYYLLSLYLTQTASMYHLFSLYLRETACMYHLFSLYMMETACTYHLFSLYLTETEHVYTEISPLQSAFEKTVCTSTEMFVWVLKCQSEVYLWAWTVPLGSPSRDGDVVVCVFWQKPTELANSFLFCSWHLFLSLWPFQV